jgi:predicted dehydrogenase
MEAMWTRFLPCMTEVRRLVASGAIGAPRLLTAQLGHVFDASSGGALWDPARGGGALLDLGPYVVALAIDLLGAVEAVAATTCITSAGVDDRAAIVLRHTGGAVSNLAVGITVAAANDAVIAGDRGHLRVHPPLYRPERITLRTARPIATGAGSTRGWRAAISERAALRRVLRRLEPLRARATGGRTIVRPYASSGYPHQVEEVLRCMRAGRTESDVMPLDDSLAVLEVLDRARLAADPPPSS